MSDDEITYQFIKGQGWVPRIGPEPEPAPPKPPWHEEFALVAERAREEAMRDYAEIRARELRQVRERDRRYFDVRTVTAQPTNWQQMYGRVNRQTRAANFGYPGGTAANHRYDYFVHDEWVTVTNTPTPRPAPVNSTPADPVASRYFPGANTPAERVTPQESQHERRAREYRESLDRYRRQRR